MRREVKIRMDAQTLAREHPSEDQLPLPPLALKSQYTHADASMVTLSSARNVKVTGSERLEVSAPTMSAATTEVITRSERERLRWKLSQFNFFFRSGKFISAKYF